MDSSNGTKKRFLGRIPVASFIREDNTSKKGAGNLQVHKVQTHVSSFDSTFGGEFNDELLCEVDKIESNFKGGNASQKDKLTRRNAGETKGKIIPPEVQKHTGVSVNITFDTANKLSRECLLGNIETNDVNRSKCTPEKKNRNVNSKKKTTEGPSFDLADLSLNSPVHISTPTDTFRRAHKSRISKLTNSQVHNITFSQPNLSQSKTALKYSGGKIAKKQRQPVSVGTEVKQKTESKITVAEIKRRNVETKEYSHQKETTEQEEKAKNNSNSHKSPHESFGNQKGSSLAPSKISRKAETSQAQEDKLLLSSWGLPEVVLKKYASVGITQMFQWQADCLCTGKVLDGGNLVYSAPTSAGKTMVAELLMLKRVLETRKKAIMILPFVSVAREKMFYLQNMLSDAGIRVDGYMGSQNPSGGFSAVDIAICTIEKANSLINRLLDEGNIHTLGIIVVDELHMVGDAHRGYLLELLLTKIRFMTIKSENKQVQDAERAEHMTDTKRRICLNNSAQPELSITVVMHNTIQLIGMSATLPNLDLLANWLDADLYHTDFRPVPLSEMVKIGMDIYDNNLHKLRTLDAKLSFKGDDEHIIPLCLETISIGCSVLIFCPTKNWCEKLADSIAREFFFLQKNTDQDKPKLELNKASLRDVCEQLRRSPVGIDGMLGKTVPQGVAFHHAGLTFDERDILEGGFRQGILKVLVATSTLSSGVNLPARRVLIRTPTFHGALIDLLTFKQMVGRAGRKGVDTQGESILVCKANEREKAKQLVKSELPPVRSCLQKTVEEGLSSSMKRALLEVVVSCVASSPAEVKAYARCTMLAASMNRELSEVADTADSGQAEDGHLNAIEACIKFLQDSEFITLRTITDNDGVSAEKFLPSQLGAAVLASALSPDEGLIVFKELQKARRCFVLENELHTVYLVTPIYMSVGSIDWYQFLCLWEQLDTGQKRVAEMVGVSEAFLAKAVRGRIPQQTQQQAWVYNVHKRFYTCLVLSDLLNEMPLSRVATKFNCNRGVLQSLQQSAATFAGMVTVFCHKLGWINLELLLSQFQSRLTFGVQRELVDLVRISLLNGQRARVVYNGGFQTVAALSNADPLDVEHLLKKSAPFMSKKAGEGESEWEAAERKKSHCIWLTGQKGLTEYEAALLIVEEAKHWLQRDLQEIGVDWKPPPEKEKDETTKEKEILHLSIGPGNQPQGITNPCTAGGSSLNTSTGNKKQPRKRSISNVSRNASLLGKIGNVSVLSPPPSFLKSRVSCNSRKEIVSIDDATKKASCEVDQKGDTLFTSRNGPGDKSVKQVKESVSSNSRNEIVSVDDATKKVSCEVDQKGDTLFTSRNGLDDKSVKQVKESVSRNSRNKIVSIDDATKKVSCEVDQKGDTLFTSRNGLDDKSVKQVKESVSRNSRKEINSIDDTRKKTASDVDQKGDRWFTSRNGQSDKSDKQVKASGQVVSENQVVPNETDKSQQLDPKCLFNISGELDISNITTPPPKLNKSRKRKSTSPVLLGGKVRKSPAETKLAGNGCCKIMSKNRWRNCDSAKNSQKSTTSNNDLLNKNMEKGNCKGFTNFAKGSMKEITMNCQETDPSSKDFVFKENHEMTSQSLDLHYSESGSLNECIIDEGFDTEEDRLCNEIDKVSEQVETELLRKKESQENTEVKLNYKIRGNTCPRGTDLFPKQSSEEVTEETIKTKVAVPNFSVEGETFCDSFMLDTQAFNVIAQHAGAQLSPQKTLKTDQELSVKASEYPKYSNMKEATGITTSPELYTENQDADVKQNSLGNSFFQSGNLVEYDRKGGDVNMKSPPLYSEELGEEDSAMKNYMLNFHTQIADVVSSASPLLTGNKAKTEPFNENDMSQGVLLPASAFDKELDNDEFSNSDIIRSQMPVMDNTRNKEEDLTSLPKKVEDSCSTLKMEAFEIGRKILRSNSNENGLSTKYSKNETSFKINKNFVFSKPVNPVRTKCAKTKACDTSVEAQVNRNKISEDDSLTFSMIEKCFSGDITDTGTQRNVKDDAKNPLNSPVIYNPEKSGKASDRNMVKNNQKQNKSISKISEKKSSPSQNRQNVSVSSHNHEKQSPSVQFSPGMEEFLNAMIDQSNFDSFSNCQTQAKQTSETGHVVRDKELLTMEKPVDVREKRIASPSGQCRSKQGKTRKRSCRQSADSSLNESNVSDCLPPTPTGEKTVVTTPSRLIGGIGKTPTRTSPRSNPRKGKKFNIKTPVRGVKELGKSKMKKELSTFTTPSGKKKTKMDSNHMKTPASMKKASSCAVFTSPGFPLTHQSFTIIDVCASAELFQTFLAEWNEQPGFSICLACEKLPPKPVENGGIGGNFQKMRTRSCSVSYKTDDGLVVEEFGLRIVGMSVTWSNRDAYFIALTEENEICDLDESLLPPELDHSLDVSERLDGVRSVLESQAKSAVCAFDVKNLMRVLSQGCGIILCGDYKDPKVADWLLDPGGKEKNIHRMVHNYLPLEAHLLEGIGGGIALSSLGLTPENPGSARVRACVESVLVHHLTRYLDTELEKGGLTRAYIEVEMAAVRVLAKMEMNGMGFSLQECETQKTIMQSKLSALEEQAYKLAGHDFSLSSTDDIAQVLYTELKLPPSGDPKNPFPTKTLGPARRVGRGRTQYSTAKDILEKLKPLHDLPGIILEWRRITSALTKVIFPLQKERTYNDRLKMYRIHGVSQSFTATGRVSMLEPNLQNIPKDFDIEMPGIIGESPTSSASAAPLSSLYSSRQKRTGDARKPVRQISKCLPGKPAPSFSVSMRHAFVPFQGGVILAADYSQLELRMIAHLSQDKKLISVLNRGGDVFKTIAAQWKSVDVNQVTPVQRQQAKQVCYGMIYGIGAKALGEQLGVDENEASVFIESFKNKYTGMRAFLRDTVNKCRERGYVETIMGRRRYLPAITDSNTHARAHAERQAVNTTVQGSAADLVKKAMVEIDDQLSDKYPDTRSAHLMHQEMARRTENCLRKHSCPEGAYFILQLHDELIYEVNQRDMRAVASIVRTHMEHTMALSVVMPVKICVGPTWGKLQEIDL